jgi:hypothetical protein
VYYRLVSGGSIPHTAPTYRRLSAQLARARREGHFPDLIDPLRQVHVPPAWPDAATFLRKAPGWFALDRTAGQTTALYVACEKDTLRAQVTGWVAEAGVPVLVVRGFSLFFIYQDRPGLPMALRVSGRLAVLPTS